MVKFSNPPPGVSDIFPDEIDKWYELEESAKKIFPLYGYREIRTPIFEYTEVFTKNIGETTDVVSKEMYTFQDKGGRSLTLRPEGTAGIIRAISGTDAIHGNEKRVFYMGPMFRGERPAAGRKRQFHQIGVENIGKELPELDIECIAMLMHYLEEIDIKDAVLLINTRGLPEDRYPAEEALKNFCKNRIDELCKDCRTRLDKNIWRILDCKNEKCKEILNYAPDIFSLFSKCTREYFETVCSGLDNLGIKYRIAPKLVRGLDYYVHTVFEVTHSSLGGQDAVAGGGRYKMIVPGEKRPLFGVGFALGMERIIMIRDTLRAERKRENIFPVCLVSLGNKAREYNMILAKELRREGIPVVMELEAKSMKAQMRFANKHNCKTVLICGEEELSKGIIIIKNMKDGSQKEIPASEIRSSVFTLAGHSKITP